MRERQQGRLPTKDEWQATQPRPPSVIRRAIARFTKAK
jgi:hypothetical protein